MNFRQKLREEIGLAFEWGGWILAPMGWKIKIPTVMWSTVRRLYSQLILFLFIIQHSNAWKGPTHWQKSCTNRLRMLESKRGMSNKSTWMFIGVSKSNVMHLVKCSGNNHHREIKCQLIQFNSEYVDWIVCLWHADPWISLIVNVCWYS